MKNLDQKEKDTRVKKEVDDTETDGNKKPREEKGIKEEGTVDTKGIKEETMGVEEKATGDRERKTERTEGNFKVTVDVGSNF